MVLAALGVRLLVVLTVQVSGELVGAMRSRS